MCAKYAVSRACFYRWQKRDVSAHAKRDAELLEKVHQAHQESHCYYGSPRVTHALKDQGIDVGRDDSEESQEIVSDGEVALEEYGGVVFVRGGDVGGLVRFVRE